MKKLSTDSDISEMVSTAQISFESTILLSTSILSIIYPVWLQKIDKTIQALLDEQVIVHCVTSPNEFVWPIFTTPKKDGDVRLTLNLKKPNESVENYNSK